MNKLIQKLKPYSVQVLLATLLLNVALPLVAQSDLPWWVAYIMNSTLAVLGVIARIIPQPELHMSQSKHG